MNTKKRFERLVYDCCVIYGNCGTGDTHIYDFLPKEGTLIASDFAHLILTAEKSAPPPYDEQDQRNFNWCAERFRSTMGAESINAHEVWD